MVAQEDKHAQGLSDLDDTAQGLRLWVKAALNVHPALNATESGGHVHDLQHVDDERLEDDGLLSDLVPITGHLTRNVEIFLDQLILLNDQNILHRIAHGASSLASASVKGDQELEGLAIGASRDVTNGGGRRRIS